MANSKFEIRPEIQALIHIVKVALFIMIAGGLTSLINNLGQLHLGPEATILVTGIINVILAGLKKYQDVK